MGNLYSRSSSRLHDSIVVGEKPSDRFTKGLAIDPATSNLYMCLLFGIKVFSSNFDYLFSLTSLSLHNAWGICIAHDKMFITEHIKSVIYVYTLEGDLISEYPISTPKKWFLSFPLGVAVDKDGNIYTCVNWCHGDKIIVLTHDDECSHYYFAPSSLKSPRDVKLYQGKVIVLDNIERGIVELKVYSKMEELLNVIRVEDVYGVYFFDVTPNSNYVISCMNRIIFVSRNGQVLESFRVFFFFLKYMYDPGIVLDNKKMEIVVLHHFEGGLLRFSRYPIKDPVFSYFDIFMSLCDF